MNTSPKGFVKMTESPVTYKTNEGFLETNGKPLLICDQNIGIARNA